ncbi:hypothetical protein AUF78_08545 [archaeon 13_1_20CM_2_51_12]|nr:MAG: hypothetical protein AUF78_08545 [archaeon 13_1_20CM_2_51_12]
MISLVRAIKNSFWSKLVFLHTRFISYPDNSFDSWINFADYLWTIILLAQEVHKLLFDLVGEESYPPNLVYSSAMGISWS